MALHFGFDGDDESVFNETADMILRMNLDTYTIYYRTVYPGTPAFEQLRLKGRLLTMDYAKYDGDHPVVQPLNMTTEQLECGLTRFTQRSTTLIGGASPGPCWWARGLLLRSPALRASAFGGSSETLRCPVLKGIVDAASMVRRICGRFYPEAGGRGAGQAA